MVNGDEGEGDHGKEVVLHELYGELGIDEESDEGCDGELEDGVAHEAH